MQLAYFTDKACERLMADAEKNHEKYLGDENWVEAYFNGSSNYFKRSSVSVENFSPYFIKEGELTKRDSKEKAEEDLINSIRLYEAFKTLTPWQAAQGNMWTYLCHMVPQYRSYIKHRWLDDPRANTIKTRYFVPSNESLRNDNALSRLWWYGYLTYDANSEDPHHLTKILFTNITIATDIIDTLNRTSPERIKGVLLALEDFKEETGMRERLSDIVRSANSAMNRHAGITTIGFLSFEEVRNLYHGHLKTALEDKASGMA